MTIECFRIPIAGACMMAALSTGVEAQERADEDPLPRFEASGCPFDASSIEVEGLRCGYLIVPESRGMDNGRTLRLAVAIAEPSGATGDPVVLLPGGPGGGPLPGGIARIRQWIPSDRTVVVFDPRGTGYSGPVMCPELNETQNAVAALDLSIEEERLLRRGAFLACRDGLLRQGIDLGAYNSTTVALDLLDLRRALGHAHWNLIGASYGVPFARAAMRVDPDGIRSAVLAVGPGPDLTDLLRRDVPFFARALERVFRGCAVEAVCTEAFPDLEGDFYRAYQSLREESLTVSVDPERFRRSTFTVNAQDFVRMIYWELTSETGVAHLPALISAFRVRDPDVVRRVVERGYGGLSSNSSRMGTSVLCYDAHTPTSRREWEEAAMPFSPTLAAIEYFLLPCEDWSGERASEEERGPHRSEIPTLVITGEYDPMSPPVTGEEHLRRLSNGYHVVIPGMGHMPRARSEPCWASLITQFVEEPTQRPDDSCTEALPPVRIGPNLPDWLDDGTDNRLSRQQQAGPVQEWLASNAIRLDTVEPGSDLTDLEPLRPIVGDARIVALGEPTHGNREVFQLKHRMIEFLVTRMGFNVLALESPMAETFDLNEFVLTGTGDPAKALAGIYYPTWDTEEVLTVIEWIREYNADPAHHPKVAFHGFDVQDPERAARVTLEYLQQVDPALAAEVLPVLAIFATPFSLPEYGGRRPIIPREGDPSAVRAIGEVVSSLDTRKEDHIAATSAAEWTLARQHARLLARYIEASSNDARDWGSVRDRAMAENVQWILEQEGDDAKVILWAHNSHVANASPWGFELMGSHLRRSFGAEMVILGFLFNRGDFRAIDAGVPSEGMRNFTVGPAPGGTVEAMFSAAGLDLAVVDMRKIPADGAVADWFREPRPTRHSGGGYNESAPDRYLLEYTIPEAFDALAFVDSTTPVRHVNEADYDVLWVREQRLPAPVNLDFEAGPPGEAPEGWIAWSRHRRLDFEMATTTERPHRGSHSAVVRRAPGQRYGEVAGSLTQRIDATPYRGKTIRLRAAARAEAAGTGDFAFLRLAIDGPASESVHDTAVPSFDSLDELRVASPDWRIHEIVAHVPEDAVVISYGLFLAGFGSAWIDEVSIEVVSAAPPPESRFLDAGGISLHYLDFGGEGLPLVFVHSEAWDAHTFTEFAPRFADRNHVLAVTRPGYGESETHPDGFGVGVQARSLVDFLDALGIERAVFAGNASVTSELTYLAERHTERVAGLVYLTGLAVPWVDAHKTDPTRAFEMFMRANPGSGDESERVRARSEYRPEFVSGDRPPIGVPALALVARSGTMGQEDGVAALALVGSPLMSEVRGQMPPSPVRDHLERLAADEAFRRRELEQIPDPIAREYFLRLSDDDSLQAEVFRYHEETILPSILAGQAQFRRAFGEHLQLRRLDVPQVVGYEYRDAPGLIEPHIRCFLERVTRLNTPEETWQTPKGSWVESVSVSGSKQHEEGR